MPWRHGRNADAQPRRSDSGGRGYSSGRPVIRHRECLSSLLIPCASQDRRAPLTSASLTTKSAGGTRRARLDGWLPPPSGTNRGSIVQDAMVAKTTSTDRARIGEEHGRKRNRRAHDGVPAKARG